MITFVILLFQIRLPCPLFSFHVRFTREFRQLHSPSNNPFVSVPGHRRLLVTRTCESVKVIKQLGLVTHQKVSYMPMSG